MDGVQNSTGINKLGAYAHFPGTGPDGKHCRQCKFFDGRELKNGKGHKGVCLKYTQLVEVKGNPPKIMSAPACRYFEEIE